MYWNNVKTTVQLGKMGLWLLESLAARPKCSKPTNCGEQAAEVIVTRWASLGDSWKTHLSLTNMMLSYQVVDKQRTDFVLEANRVALVAHMGFHCQCAWNDASCRGCASARLMTTIGAKAREVVEAIGRVLK